MMNWWKWFLMALAVFAGLAIVVLGPVRLWQQIRLVRMQAVQSLDEGMTDEQVLARAGEQVRWIDTQIRAYHVKVAQAADKAAAAEVRVRELRKRHIAEKRRLAQATQVLEEPGPTYEVSGRTYTQREIREDVRARLMECRRLEQKLADEEKLARGLKETLEQGRANLIEARALRQQTLGELEALRGRLANARARKDLAAMRAALNESPFAPDSELTRKIAAIRDRARKLEHEADYDSASPNRPLVDWDRGNSDDVRQEARKYLRREDSLAGARK